MSQTMTLDAMRSALIEIQSRPRPATTSPAPTFEQKTDGFRGNLAPNRRRDYILAGNATFTIKSPSDVRFTYKVKKAEPKEGYENAAPSYFVSLLTGPVNTNDFTYIGMIFGDGMFHTTKASKLAMTTPSVRAIAWFLAHVTDGRVEVWHEGRCGCCNRPLTVPESIESGIGPICAEKGL